jgi:hypothetical protein
LCDFSSIHILAPRHEETSGISAVQSHDCSSKRRNGTHGNSRASDQSADEANGKKLKLIPDLGKSIEPFKPHMLRQRWVQAARIFGQW